MTQIDDNMKLRFASVFARTNNAATAAMSIIPNPGEALRQSYVLQHDPVVVEEMARLKDTIDEKERLPSKVDIALEVLERARELKDPEDYAKLMRLYCEIGGLLEKPGANVDVNVQVASVMVVKDHGTTDEWKNKAADQQRRLTLDASV
jgi:hypothetical protein